MNRPVWLKWMGALSAIALLALLFVYTYDLGVAHGLAESAKVGGLGGQGGPVFWWWRPWGFGFFPLLPFLILLWLVLRAFRGPWYRRGWYGRPMYGPGWNDRGGGVPPAFEEWHRRAHAEREGTGGGGTETSSGRT